MARTKKGASIELDSLARLLGEALGAGLVEGLRTPLETLKSELAPLEAQLLSQVRDDLEAQLAEGAEEAAELVAEGLRACAEAGCSRRAVARGLCRRHYARITYAERRERQGGTVRTRAAKATERQGGKSVEKKPVAAVAPIVRRKKDQQEAKPAPAAPAPVLRKTAASEATPAARPPAPGGISVESMARFLGLEK